MGCDLFGKDGKIGYFTEKHRKQNGKLFIAKLAAFAYGVINHSIKKAFNMLIIQKHNAT